MKTIKITVFFSLLFCSLLSIAALNVQGVRVSPGTDKTRVVFDLSTKPDYRLSQISSPERVVIDLTNASLKTSLSSPNLANTSLSSIRHAVRNLKDLRIVLDLTKKQQVKSFVLKPSAGSGYRLVIDLASSVKAQSIVKTTNSVNKGQRKTIIAIDPGHGGKDPGAIGRHSQEKHVVLAIAKELKKVIDATPGYAAILTRSDDRFIYLGNRPKIARDKKADLFVSIHADSFRKSSANGASVFSLSLGSATSTMAKLLADKENAADLIAGVDLSGKPDVLRQVIGELTIANRILKKTQDGLL